MMKKILPAAFLLISLFATWTFAGEDPEKKKIEFLISSIENVREAKFIRNGVEYSAADAAKHLRMKLEKAGGRVKTADDFIRLCASRSYITGAPYLIKLPDGKTVTSENFLRAKLREYLLRK